ncbi:MAG: ATP-binding protein [Candidatus Hermodarchaeota archaeon]
MIDIIPPPYITEKFKSFKVLNSYLRHNALSSLNTASLAVHMIKIGESDEELIEMLSNSLETVTNLLIRTHDIERILEFYKVDLETLKVFDLFEEASKEYYAKSIEFIIEGDHQTQIESYYGEIFRGIFRNALQYRNADEIRVNIQREKKSNIIHILDNGDNLSTEIKSDLIKQVQFNSRKHDQSYIDLFIVNEILKNYNNIIRIEENTPKGSSFTIIKYF